MFDKLYESYMKAHPHCSSEEATTVASEMMDRRCGMRHHRLPGNRYNARFHYDYRDYNDYTEEDEY